MKGAALSYLIYPDPNLRACCDIDVLIDPKKIAVADTVLRSLGYKRTEIDVFEFTYARAESGVETLIDLHWKLSNLPILSGIFDFEEIYGRSIPISALSPWARALGAVDSLINACIHMAQHRTWDRLIWLADVYLLLDRLSCEELNDFVARVVRGRCSSLCLRALKVTRKVYGVELNHPAIRRLIDRESSGIQKYEPSDYLLAPYEDLVYEDLRLMMVISWGERFRLLWRKLFPPLRALDERYDTRSKVKIPFIYLYRLIIMLPVRLILTGRFILRVRRKGAQQG